jgi:hypothetical protein
VCTAAGVQGGDTLAEIGYYDGSTVATLAERHSG